MKHLRTGFVIVGAWTLLCSSSGCSKSDGSEAPRSEPIATGDAGVTFPASATNGVKDGTETDRDCGGTAAPSCATGKRCKVAPDCGSNVCVGSACQAPANADGVKNGDETDVDCGGSSGISCAPAKACLNAADCSSTCTSLKCDAPSDRDLKKNNGETDVDCGGPNAKKCAIGNACTAATDCGLGECASAACAKPSSSDGKKNGSETDVDCGGTALTYDNISVAAAPRCADAKLCDVDADCSNTVCATNKRCVEAPSCRNVRGGFTCGVGETGTAAARHESCCISYPVPGVSVPVAGVPKQVHLDKYEITAGRVRAWLTDIRRQYNGVPNVQAWVNSRKASDPYLAAMYPPAVMGYLPKQEIDQPVVDANGVNVQYKVYPTFVTTPGSEFYNPNAPDPNNVYITRDAGLFAQIGPTSYYRGVTGPGTSGCAMYKGNYGHRTYDDGPAVNAYFGEPRRSPASLAESDDKAVNCLPPLMYAAFCAWDGGYLTSKAAVIAAYGSELWPWGAAPTAASLNLTSERTMLGNFNWGVNYTPFSNTRRPAYSWPALNDDTWSLDYTPLIAAPGRFPADIASNTRPGQPSWMDMGSNMIELSQTSGSVFGWFGSSWEGHVYPRGWDYAADRMEKYGKSGARCMRLR
jgi:hypothetical protein